MLLVDDDCLVVEWEVISLERVERVGHQTPSRHLTHHCQLCLLSSGYSLE